MKIAVDARVLNETAGKAVYTRSVLREMLEAAPQSQFELYGYTPIQGEYWPANAHFHPLNDSISRLSSFRQLDADVLFSPSSYLSTLLSNRPTLTTIHDLVAYKTAVKLPLKTRLAERLLLGAAVRRSRSLTVQNRATYDDLVDLFPAAHSKTEIVKPGIAAMSDRQALPTQDDQSAYLNRLGASSYLLFVGTLEPRKNLVRLIRAYTELPTEIKADFQLVLAGGRGWLDAVLSQQLAQLPLGVILAGRVSNAELATLYANTGLVIYPSLYEGVGYPVLEGMSWGKPVITSNVGAMAEIGSEAAVLVDPTSVAEMSDAIAQVLKDSSLASSLATRGQAVAKGYSWAETARSYLAILERIA